MAKPRKKGISDEILRMIGESAKQAPPTRAREMYFDMQRKREPQDATRIVPKRVFVDDVPHRNPRVR